MAITKAMRSTSINRRRIGLLAFAVLCTVAAVIVVPHRFSTTKAQITLQTGYKMQVQVSLRSPWGWAAPTHLASMHVFLDGREIPLPAKALAGLQPLDPERRPVIAEREGFPEVIVFGLRGSSLAEVSWRFLNFSLSEKDVIRRNNLEKVYFAPSSFACKQVALSAFSGSRMIAMAPAKLKNSSARDFSK